MEILLHEHCRIPYARNMYGFGSHIYFNTFKRSPKPGDSVFPLDQGLLRILMGTDSYEKVFDFEIEQYSVISNKVYFYNRGVVHLFDMENKELTVCQEFLVVSYDYFTKRTYFTLRDENQQSSTNFLVYFTDLYFEKLQIFGRINNGFVLVNQLMDINVFKCFDFKGNFLWEVKISDLLEIPDERLKWGKNNIERIYSINNYWIIYYCDNTILKLDCEGQVGWSNTKSDIHTYLVSDEILYCLSNKYLSKVDPNSGELLLSTDILKVKEKYRSEVYRGGMWVYENYIFLPSPKKSIEWLVFDKNTLEEVGHMYIQPTLKDEIVRIPGQFCSNFIYSKGKVYINDTADWLRIYDIEFK
jgi:hypothetical protein